MDLMNRRKQDSEFSLYFIFYNMVIGPICNESEVNMVCSFETEMFHLQQKNMFWHFEWYQNNNNRYDYFDYMIPKNTQILG